MNQSDYFYAFKMISLDTEKLFVKMILILSCICSRKIDQHLMPRMMKSQTVLKYFVKDIAIQHEYLVD